MALPAHPTTSRLPHLPALLWHPSPDDVLPAPLDLPFPLRPVHSADRGVERTEDGRTRYWIRHDLLRGVTPAMLAWWFANLEGTIRFGGRDINRYRFWHPRDHVHASYAKRLPDGSIGPGAQIRLIEVLGRNPRFRVDTVTHIERLDEGGFTHLPEFRGHTGLVRMDYTFTRTARGTLFENSLTFGSTAPWYPLVRPLAEALAFPPSQGQAWLQHNIEEVGMFEAFLPDLFRQETGRAG